MMDRLKTKRPMVRLAMLLGVSTALAVGPVSLALAQSTDPAPAQEPLPSFAPMVAKVMPAVVNISVVEKAGAAPVADEAEQDDQQPFQGGPGATPFDDMLRHFFEQQQPGQQAPGPQRQMMALGS